MRSFSHIDIHTHVNFAAFDSDRDEVIKRALDNSVAIVNVGTQKDTSRKAVELAERYKEGVYACVGIHPIHSDKSFHDKKELGEEGAAFTSRGEEFDVDFYSELAKHPKVLAIGECGLDYYHDTHPQISANDPSSTAELTTGHSANKKQEENFRKQIELAVKVRKPLMLHLRNSPRRSAYHDAFSILQSYPSTGVKLGTGHGNLNLQSGHPGNLHFFAGSIAEAKPFLDAGYTFSFTGVITFSRDYDEIIRYLPLGRILSETDAPYVAPAPYRGKRNEPSYVVEVVKAIADTKHEKLETVKESILATAAKLFNLFQ